MTPELEAQLSTVPELIEEAADARHGVRAVKGELDHRDPCTHYRLRHRRQPIGREISSQDDDDSRLLDPLFEFRHL